MQSTSVPDRLPLSRASVQADAPSTVPLLVAAICASEVVLVFGHLVVGVLLEALILGLILTLQASRPRRADRRAMAPLALVPMLRLLSLTTPLPGLPSEYWLALAGAPLLAGGILAARGAGLNRSALGLQRTRWEPQVAIAVLGIPAGYVLWSFAQPAPMMGPDAQAGELFVAALFLVLFVGVAEEFIFRGVIQAGLSVTYARGAVLLGAIVYGATYLASLSFEYTLFMTLAGLAYGLLVQRTGSIIGVSVSHALLVLGALLVWPAISG
jgi:membrane protease YdiL (CAAX protease family)